MRRKHNRYTIKDPYCLGKVRSVRKAERLSVILDQVGEHGTVDVGTLAETLGVSGATIRRDLQSLSRHQLLVRTHGGAIANQSGDEVPTRVKAALRQARVISKSLVWGDCHLRSGPSLAA
jgi:Mn-dependent DtxR family transcriptional regulator